MASVPNLVAVDVVGGGAPPREIEVVPGDGVRVRVAHDVSLERLGMTGREGAGVALVLSRLGQGRISLASGATDMRKSFNGLSGLVRSRLAGDPLSGDLFVFCNGTKNWLKILFCDSTGQKSPEVTC